MSPYPGSVEGANKNSSYMPQTSTPDGCAPMDTNGGPQTEEEPQPGDPRRLIRPTLPGAEDDPWDYTNSLSNVFDRRKMDTW